MKTKRARPARRWTVALTDRTQLGAPIYLVSRYGGMTSLAERAMAWPTKREAQRWLNRTPRPARYVCTLVRLEGPGS